MSEDFAEFSAENCVFQQRFDGVVPEVDFRFGDRGAEQATAEETPAWLAPLAEAIGGWRLNPGRVTEPIIDDVLTGLRAQIAALPASAPAAQWAQWILADRRTRAISPGSPITVPEYVQRRIAEDRVESLREAVRLAPDNALAFARLARLMATRATPDGGTNFAEARWLIHRAAALSPALEEVRRIQELIPEPAPRHPQ